MSNYRVFKSILNGRTSVPASKSHTLRAILFAALGAGKSIIRQYLPSPDAEAMIKACQLLGAKIISLPNSLEIIGLNGKISIADDVINAGNSGIVLRFIPAILALSPHYGVITGDDSIRHQRPIRPLLEALIQLGATAISTKEDDFAPIIIRGPLKAGSATLSGKDSQPVSALIIASAFIEGVTELHVKDPGEKPWILLTLNWLDRLGIRYENHDFMHYRIFGKTSYPGFDYTVPGDLSSAAFPIAAALITGSELTIDNIDMTDLQGDKELIYVLQKMGARIEIDDFSKTLTVKKGGRLRGLEVDVNAFIDAVPILTVIGCFAEGITRITNAAIARQKESDRLSTITTELKKMGAQITELSDGLVIEHSSLRGARVHSHHDHRIAMSLAVAGLGAEGETLIENIECVAKTFPRFAQTFQEIGSHVEIISGGNL